jgi:uncharacterized membrane protein YeaQ/YmgE (transglycosylase-associated protein family)
MLEIFFLMWFGKKLRAILETKSRSKGWVALGICFWFGGELIGFMVGSLLGWGQGGAYGLALLFAVVGAVVSWAIVNSLPPATESAAPSV